jgi:hypothetical protein
VGKQLVTKFWRGEVPRVLVHAVADGSSDNYFPAYRRFLSFCKTENQAIDDPLNAPQVDDAFVWFCEYCCFYLRLSFAVGKAARSCHTHLYPQVKGRLPLSGRAIHSWEKLQGGELEREPLCWFFVVLVCEALGRMKPAMGIAAWAQADTLMREEDVEELRWDDVTVSAPVKSGEAPGIALEFSPIERGATTKGGPSQGVEVLDPSLRWWFAREKKQHSLEEKVFQFSMDSYRRYFSKALDTYEVKELGGPHLMRHSGAVRLLQEGVQKPLGDGKRWSYPRTQGRGRWLQERSLHHYSKPHLRLKNLARLSEERRQMAQELIDNGFPFW